MPIIATVGRRALRVRVLLLCMYALLSLLGLTMVVPFLITVCSSGANDLDYDRFQPIPRVAWSADDRFARGLVLFFNKYPQWASQIKVNLPSIPAHWTTWRESGRDYKSIKTVADTALTGVAADPQRQRLAAADYSRFVDDYPVTDLVVPVLNVDASPFLEQYYRQKWADAHAGKHANTAAALDLLNQTWGAAQTNFFSIDFEKSEILLPYWQQSWFPPDNPKYRDYLLIRDLYRKHCFTPGVAGAWRSWLRGKGIAVGKNGDLTELATSTDPQLRKSWGDFKAEYAPAAPAVPFSMKAVWLTFLPGDDARKLLKLQDTEKFDVAMYNRLAGTQYSALSQTPFPLPADAAPAMRTLWKAFIETRWPIRLTAINATPEMAGQYREFLRGRFKTVEYTNKILLTSATTWDDFALSPTAPTGAADEKLGKIWADFVKNLPAEQRILSCSEIAYQNYLLTKYSSVAGVNQAYGWNLSRLEEAFPAFQPAYAITFHNIEWPLTFGPLVKNYSFILAYMFKQGRAIFVTFFLIAITVLMTLTVNPMAAYALSRFSLRGKDKILIFLLATMAFPAMISAIPAYLLMRDLGLLNTFFALVLPGAANGMAIFMLKGFFDSLPPELYEAATIDGAKEWQIFLKITLPMMKPILAINALTAFMGAYNGWEWALIICQDVRMWTISVWMYQANQLWSVDYPWIVTAGFVVVSIPTLFVFLFCQKIILQGIVIPQMK